MPVVVLGVTRGGGLGGLRGRYAPRTRGELLALGGLSGRVRSRLRVQHADRGAVELQCTLGVHVEQLKVHCRDGESVRNVNIGQFHHLTLSEPQGRMTIVCRCTGVLD